MTALMAKMAQRASDNPSLMASILDHYTESKGLQWKDLAVRLRVEDQEVEKLALCRRPRKQSFSEDIDQIAGYVKVDRTLLTELVREAEQIAPALKEKKVQAQPVRVSVPRKRPTWIYAAGAVAALVLLILASAIVFAQPDQTAATLVVADGQAIVNHTDRLLGLFPVQTQMSAMPGKSLVVGQSDTIQVGEGASVELKLQDGSVVELSENSILQVSELVVTQDSTRVRLRLLAGRAVSRVRKLLGVDDVFEIITPSSTVTVRGTEFIVKVLSPDTTFVACLEGLVVMQVGDQIVEVAAGQQVIGTAGEPLKVVPYTGVEPDFLATTNSEGTPGPLTGSDATATPVPTDATTTPVSDTPTPGGENEGSTDGGTTNTGTSGTVPTDDPSYNPPPGQGGEIPGTEGGVPPGQSKKTPTSP